MQFYLPRKELSANNLANEFLIERLLLSYQMNVGYYGLCLNWPKKHAWKALGRRTKVIIVIPLKFLEQELFKMSGNLGGIFAGGFGLFGFFLADNRNYGRVLGDRQWILSNLIKVVDVHLFHSLDKSLGFSRHAIGTITWWEID
jgi:hypothetical protein